MLHYGKIGMTLQVVTVPLSQYMSDIFICLSLSTGRLYWPTISWATNIYTNDKKIDSLYLRRRRSTGRSS